MLIHKAFMVQRKVFALCLNFLLNVLLMIFITTPTLPLPLLTPPPLTPPPLTPPPPKKKVLNSLKFFIYLVSFV